MNLFIEEEKNVPKIVSTDYLLSLSSIVIYSDFCRVLFILLKLVGACVDSILNFKKRVENKKKKENFQQITNNIKKREINICFTEKEVFFVQMLF